MTQEEQGLPTEELDNIEFTDLVVEKEIGKGSFGTVYKATFFGVEVAVKQIKKPSGPDGADFEKYLEREIQVQKCMRHPNIVQFIGVAKKQGETWLALQYVGGGGLDNYLENEKRAMTWDVRLKLALDIAYAMAYLHSKKILYRDLKAKNVVVEETGNGGLKGYLCDFGFARTLSTADMQKQQAHLTICGTDDYMAPEVILGMPYDQKADVYSFGIFVLELLYRRKLGDILDRKPQNAFDLEKDEIRKKLPADCPPLFTELFLACCEYEPKKRPTFKDVIIIVSTMLKNMLKNMPGGGASAANNSSNNSNNAPLARPTTPKVNGPTNPISPTQQSTPTAPKFGNSGSSATSSPSFTTSVGTKASNPNRAGAVFAAPPLKPAMANVGALSPPTTHKASPVLVATATTSSPDTALKSRPPAQRAAPTLTKQLSGVDLNNNDPNPNRPVRSPSAPSVPTSATNKPGGFSYNANLRPTTPASPTPSGGSAARPYRR